MKTLRLFTLVAALAHLAANVSAQQYRMPQDNWYYNGVSIAGNFGAIAIGPDDNIHAATNNSAVAVFRTDGAFVRQLGSNMKSRWIAFSSETNVYALDNLGTRTGSAIAGANSAFEFAYYYPPVDTARYQGSCQP